MASVDASLITFAHSLADAAGAVIAPYFRQPIGVDYKSDASPVTKADREAEEAIRALIRAHYPAHAIVGEELAQEGDSDWQWVIDPIDGTRAFISGKPQFVTLIALCHKGKPVLGVIDQPITKERWVGAEGQPSTLNGKVISTHAIPSPVYGGGSGRGNAAEAREDSPHLTSPRTREEELLASALLSTTSPHYFSGEEFTKFERLRTQCRDTIYGGDGYAYGLLAAGCIDIVAEAQLKQFDVMALIPVIEGAGGTITNWQGKPVHEAWDGTLLAAANAELHKAALAALK